MIGNWKATISEATGTYVAICEGDDYWIDDNKLQKQVDFLEVHPQYGGVSTNNKWFFKNENRFQDDLLDQEPINFENLLDSNTINSQTMLFKKELIDDLDWITPLKICDWPLHLLVTSQQPHYRLADITSVYRVHEGSVYSLLHEEEKIRHRIAVLFSISKLLPLTDERKKNCCDDPLET